MKKKSLKVAFWLFFYFLILLDVSFGTLSAIQITNAGKPKALILVDPAASADDQWIAGQLQKYLKDISGANIDIVTDTNLPDKKKGIQTVIIVGIHPQLDHIGIGIDSNAEDAFIIKTIDEYDYPEGDEISIISLAGNGLRGTIYSVYAFLEEIGCRWFMPGEVGEVVPKTKNITINPMNVLEIPDFEVRHYAGDGGEPKLSPEDRLSFKLWMLKNRFSRGFEKGFTHLDAFKGRGGHDYKEMIPSSLFSTHPEYFPLIGENRINNGQRCIGEEGVLEEAKRYVDRFFKNHPNSEIVSLSPNDNNLWCSCEKCTALDGEDKFIEGSTKLIPTFSGRVFRFANSVSEYMANKHPDKYANIFAYAYYSAPPNNFIPSDNLIIKLCHNLNACDNHSIGSNCKYGKWFRENVVHKWKNITPNLWYHHYTYRWKAYEIIWPFWKVAAEDIRFLNANDFWGFFAMGGSMNWGSNGLYYYVISRLLWDADANVDLIIEDYCKKFYGISGKDMKDYFDHMADVVTNSNTHIRNQSGGLTYVRQFTDVYTPKLLNDGQRFLNRAANKAKKNPTIRKRIQVIQYTHTYTQLLMELIKADTKAKETGSEKDRQKVKSIGKTILNHLEKKYVPWSITLKTGSFGAQTYVQNILKQY